MSIDHSSIEQASEDRIDLNIKKETTKPVVAAQQNNKTPVTASKIGKVDTP